MNARQRIWQSWTKALRQRGLTELTAWLLESTGPFALIIAQGVYLVQPLIHSLMPDEHWAALTDLLEDRNQQKAFITHLTKGENHELG